MTPKQFTKFRIMARTRFVTIPSGQEDIYAAALQSGDRFTFSKIVRKTTFYGRKKIAGLTRRSYIPAISVIWRSFSDATKADWKTAATERGLNGWQAFVADQAKRIKFGIPGEATPTALHQDLVGLIYITAPAEEVKIAQYHPAQYWVSQKVQGKKGMYEPISVTEEFALPIELSINYKSNLVSTGAGSFAKFYAVVRHSYQGVNRETNLELDIPLIGGWANLNDTLSEVLGEVQGYDLYIHLYKVTGTLHYDNPEVNHSSSNWLRDPYCKDISKSFTRAFYQVAASWQAITLPTGTTFNSVYPT